MRGFGFTYLTCTIVHVLTEVQRLLDHKMHFVAYYNHDKATHCMYTGRAVRGWRASFDFRSGAGGPGTIVAAGADFTAAPEEVMAGDIGALMVAPGISAMPLVIKEVWDLSRAR